MGEPEKGALRLLFPHYWGLVGLLALLFVAPACAQSGTARVGPVNVTWQRGHLDSTHLDLLGGVTMNSANFDLAALTAHIDFASGKKGASGVSAIARATLDADLAHGQQIVGRFAQIEMARTYRVRADHAVYVPDPTRPGGGKVDFTGHVVIALLDAGALDGPALMQVDHAVALLGQGPSYPSFDFSAGQFTATPLH